eukprot:200220_1
MASKSTILCEYYLWVRWCNIREINGYYIYNGMKGNKLSFVHQQNRKLIIYFHTLSHQHESSFTFPYSSIPENREEDDNDIDEIKPNFDAPSPHGSPSLPSQTFNIAVSGAAAAASSSNTSTPCSSPPPESPLSRAIPRLSYADSNEDTLVNHWVIKCEHDILYYTKDKHEGNNSIDNEYPPSYGWNYNEKNQSSLPKSYQKGNALINFGAPPPGITRIPIIPEPMIKTFKNGTSSPNNVYSHGSFKNGQTQAKNANKIALITNPFDVPVHYMDVIFDYEEVDDDVGLGFGIRVDTASKILQIDSISSDCMASKLGLKQGDMILAVNEEDIGCCVDEGLSKLSTEMKSAGEDKLVHMTVCRRIFDDIMIIVRNAAGKEACNGHYYFHHLDEFECPVFMQDEEDERMIIRKAHYENGETGESLWTISDKSEDYYVGLSVNTMPPNGNWESISKTQEEEEESMTPMLVFYNKNEKLHKDEEEETKSTQNSLDKAQLDNVLNSVMHPSLSYTDPNGEQITSGTTPTTPGSTHSLVQQQMMEEEDEATQMMSINKYRVPSWKKKKQQQQQQTDYDVLYAAWCDLSCTFYGYWRQNKKLSQEIDRLRDTISQHGNRFIVIRKELFQQKRREEDLLDKINSLQTHSRQVSSISALFDSDYNLDMEELQELHKTHVDDTIAFDNDALDTSALVHKQLDRIGLETEITELKVALEAKDVKIGELEIEINSWQETHSQIYDSFTSATRIYREQVEQFNEEEKLYKQKNNDLEKRIMEMNREEEEEETLPKRRYTDIDAELEYNSDESSSATEDDGSTSDDSIGGGAHVRRSSKPWIGLKQKLMKRHKKQQKEKEEAQKNMQSPPPPERKESDHNLLTNETYLTSVPSDEDTNKIVQQPPMAVPVISVDSTWTMSDLDRPEFRERHTEITNLYTPNPEEEEEEAKESDSTMPSHPFLHTARGQSHLSSVLGKA